MWKEKQRILKKSNNQEIQARNNYFQKNKVL